MATITLTKQDYSPYTFDGGFDLAEMTGPPLTANAIAQMWAGSIAPVSAPPAPPAPDPAALLAKIQTGFTGQKSFTFTISVGVGEHFCDLCSHPAATRTSQTHITVQALIAEIRRISVEMPTRRWPGGRGCYVASMSENGVACLIGVALTRLGVPDEMMAPVANYGICGILGHLGIACTYPQRAWLSHVQSRQDACISWGEAVRSADRLVSPAAL